jgi:Tol biopolymer transport system component
MNRRNLAHVLLVLLVLFAAPAAAGAQAGGSVVMTSRGDPVLRPQIRTLFESDLWISTGPAVSPDGRWIVYGGGPDFIVADLHLLDRRSGRSRPLASGTLWGAGVAWAPGSDRLAYVRWREDREDAELWTLLLDPETGQARGPAQRLSTGPAWAPAFSPDGREVAYATQQPTALAIVPASGGRERIIFRGLTGNFAWSPGGRWIYFTAPDTPGGPLRMRRVAAAGGAPQTLAGSAGGEFLGLSHDGSMTAFYLSEQSVVIVNDTAGERVAFVVLPPRTEARGWSPDRLSLLGVQHVHPSTTYTINLATGAHSAISTGLAEADDASFSPDGRQIALQATVDGRRHIVLSDATGGARRVLKTREPLSLARWSPDGRYLAYIGRSPDQPSASTLTVFDVQAGTESYLGVSAPSTAYRGRLPAFWRADSRALLRVRIAGPDSVEIGDVDLDGNFTVLHAFRPSSQPGVRTTLLSGDWVALQDTSRIELRNLRTGRTLTAHHSSSRNNAGIVGLSPDERTLALRVFDPAAQQPAWRMKLVPLDGGPARYVTTGMEEVYRLQVVFTPDGRHLVVRGALTSGSETRSLRLVPLDGGPWRDIATSIGAMDARSELVVSPDGRTLLVSLEQRWSGRLVEIELADLAEARARRR